MLLEGNAQGLGTAKVESTRSTDWANALSFNRLTTEDGGQIGDLLVERT